MRSLQRARSQSCRPATSYPLPSSTSYVLAASTATLPRPFAYTMDPSSNPEAPAGYTGHRGDWMWQPGMRIPVEGPSNPYTNPPFPYPQPWSFPADPSPPPPLRAGGPSRRAGHLYSDTAYPRALAPTRATSPQQPSISLPGHNSRTSLPQPHPKAALSVHPGLRGSRHAAIRPPCLQAALTTHPTPVPDKRTPVPEPRRWATILLPDLRIRNRWAACSNTNSIAWQHKNLAFKINNSG